MRIEVQGGTQLELPDGSTPAQIDEVVNHFQSTQGGTKQPAQQPDVSMGRTALDQGVQGATFGFGDEITDRLGAAGASLVTGEKYNDLLKEARANSKDRLSAEFQQHPVVAVGSNLAGTLLTGGAGATTKAGAAIANSLRTGNTAARIAKGALAGAASGGLYGAGAADDGNRLQGAESGAILGGVTGGAIPAAGAALSDVGSTIGNVGKGLLAKTPEAVQDAAASLKSGASDLYDQMRQSGANFNSKSAGNLLSGIKSTISNQQFIPELNPKTLAIVNHLDNRIAQAAQGGELSLSELDQYRRLLGKIGATEDGVSAGAVRKQIDSFVNNATAQDLSNGSTNAINLLNKGRAQYSQASKYEDIADVLTKAAGDPNKIKAGLTRFLNNDNNTRGWSPAELEALKNAASTGGTEKLLKMGGKFGIDLGTSLTPGNTVAPLIGGAINPAIPVAGTVARQAQKYAARGKAQSLLNVIEKGGNGAAPSAAVSPLLSAPAGQAAGMIENRPSSAMPQTVTAPQTPQAMPAPQANATPSNDLFSRVIKQESGGNQSAVSRKGAVGVAQLMPRTAPEAAQAAGLPYDFNKFVNDPEYNAALGKAYLGKLMAKYSGNQVQALMAYNWGQGNVDKWIRAGSNPNHIPAETRNYIKNILAM